MKTVLKKAVALLLALLCLFAFASCSRVTENSSDSASDTASDKVIKIPEIQSEDTVMPKFLDISLYDVENYADIYLGKNFKFQATYEGTEISVPTTYSTMQKKNWKLKETEEINPSSIILAGKTLEATFENSHGIIINAVFYNSSKSSVELKECKIVKFSVLENNLYNSESQYGQFWINGVSNSSDIAGIIEYLGAPSHFYAVSENEYYLDYFISEKDKRSGITVYVDPVNDDVKSIIFAKY